MSNITRRTAIAGVGATLGVGAFAKKRAELALAGGGPRIAAILHPSPANPRANANWSQIVREQLAELGLCSGAS